MMERCRNQGAPFPQQQCGFHHEGWCDVRVLQGRDRRYQAECPNCGWHTREAEWRHWALVMADRHEVTCSVMHRAAALTEERNVLRQYDEQRARADAAEAKPVQGMADGLALRIEDAIFESNEDARFHTVFFTGSPPARG